MEIKKVQSSNFGLRLKEDLIGKIYKEATIMGPKGEKLAKEIKNVANSIINYSELSINVSDGYFKTCCGAPAKRTYLSLDPPNRKLGENNTYLHGDKDFLTELLEFLNSLTTDAGKWWNKL